MYENERRQHDRLYHHTQVHITTSTNESLIVYTLNLSDGGLLLKYHFEPLPVIGEIMQIQAMDFPDAPIKKVIVRRTSEAGQIGVEFI